MSKIVDVKEIYSCEPKKEKSGLTLKICLQAYLWPNDAQFGMFETIQGFQFWKKECINAKHSTIFLEPAEGRVYSFSATVGCLGM